MIILPVDFVDRPYKVPNQEEARDFSSLLDGWEEGIANGTLPDEAVRLLGVDLWDEFSDALNTSGVIADKWIRLRDGATYTYGGKTSTYLGWVDMIRPALYALWIPTTTYKLTNIGFVENNAPEKSSLMDDQYPFVVKYWNEFVSRVGFGYNCRRNSFYGFMEANKADYPDWDFKAPELKNRYGL